MGRNNWFEFKQFRIEQKDTAMKVGTDGVLLGAWTDTADSSRILDVGTGTGLIALMLAQRSMALIDAIEIDQFAAREASLNFNGSLWKDRLRIYSRDFKDFGDQNPVRYDLIVSNPPFFINSLKTPDLSTAIARHDISLSYEQLIARSVLLLQTHGRLCVIIPSENLDIFRETARLNGFYLKRRTDVITILGKAPRRVLLEFSLIPTLPLIDQLVLRNTNTDFSEEFIKLTSPYYLNF
jgi:tRNA1Val (adenine37-N6)-methyltransferase